MSHFDFWRFLGTIAVTVDFQNPKLEHCSYLIFVRTHFSCTDSVQCQVLVNDAFSWEYPLRHGMMHEQEAQRFCELHQLLVGRCLRKSR